MTETARAMHQPRKSVLRDALRSAADTIERQAAELDDLRQSIDDHINARFLSLVAAFALGVAVGVIAAVLS